MPSWLNRYRSEKSNRAVFLKWLGEDGKQFFKDLYTKHGRLDVVYTEAGIPHVVHFREGMQIRNWMRKNTRKSHDYIENNWMDFVLEAIKEEM